MQRRSNASELLTQDTNFFFALRLILISASTRSSTGCRRFAFRRIQTSASSRMSTCLSFFAIPHARRKGNTRHLCVPTLIG